MTFRQWLRAQLDKLLKPQPDGPPPPPPPPSGENLILDEINRFRAANNRQPYRHSVCLTQQASQWAAAMQRAGSLSHAQMSSRLSACGIQAGGEVVAAGQRTPAEVVDAWMRSPGHRAILLSDYEVCGAESSGSYWCALAGDSSLLAFSSVIDPREVTQER